MRLNKELKQDIINYLGINPDRRNRDFKYLICNCGGYDLIIEVLKEIIKEIKEIKPNAPKEDKTENIFIYSYINKNMDIGNFYIPNDKILKRYKIAVEKLEQLPASFYLPNEENPDAQGTPLLELKKHLIKPIKNIPLFSKLIDGSYHTEKSNSDLNISRSIKFFVSNLPSFLKYKDDNDLSYIIKNHRLLTVEIFEYYAKKPNTSLRTIEGRFVAICRIFKIAYETKNYPLYQKYSEILLDLNASAKMDEADQKLNINEEKTFINFSVVLETQKKLNQEFIKNPTYQKNQDLLLLSIYSLIPTLRDELKLLEFTTTKKTDRDYIFFNKNNDVFIDLNKTKKKHNEITFNISQDAPELAEIIKQSYKLYPRNFLFTNYDDINEKAQIQNLTRRLNKIFKFTGKNIGVNSLRSSYASYLDENRMTVKEKDKLAEKMRTSRRYLDLNYIKILPSTTTIIKQDKILNEEMTPKEDLKNSYEKQLIRSKKYYDDNKNKVLAKQKENRNSKPKEELARKKIIYYLNNDDNYKNKIKPETVEKYNIKINNGIYY